jgi:hypothetical protein
MGSGRIQGSNIKLKKKNRVISGHSLLFIFTISSVKNVTAKNDYGSPQERQAQPKPLYACTAGGY